MNKIDSVLRAVDRGNFVATELFEAAKYDIPLPIGYGQTISQPSTVKQMLKWLDLRKGQKVLDLGSGSGWTTALIAHVVGGGGMVFAVERIPELVIFGRNNCTRLGIANAKFFLASNVLGYPKCAPYDRILVSATADKVPKILLDQLKINGKMVIPVNNNLLEITKVSAQKYDTIVHPGFIFVPLIYRDTSEA